MQLSFSFIRDNYLIMSLCTLRKYECRVTVIEWVNFKQKTLFLYIVLKYILENKVSNDNTSNHFEIKNMTWTTSLDRLSLLFYEFSKLKLSLKLQSKLINNIRIIVKIEEIIFKTHRTYIDLIKKKNIIHSTIWLQRRLCCNRIISFNY